jgi:hypothetical protein
MSAISTELSGSVTSRLIQIDDMSDKVAVESIVLTYSPAIFITPDLLMCLSRDSCCR